MSVCACVFVCGCAVMWVRVFVFVSVRVFFGGCGFVGIFGCARVCLMCWCVCGYRYM